MPQRPATVPSFSLYGEAEQALSPGFVHIETIAVRSLLHEWEISPHRHRQSLQLLLVSSGQVEALLEAAQLVLEGPCFVLVPQGAVHGFRFEPGTCGHVLTVSGEYLTRFAQGDDPLLALLTRGQHGALTGEEQARTAWLAGQLLALTGGWQSDWRLVHALTESLLRCLPAVPDPAPGEPRLARLRQLIETHFREHRPVSFYAARLGLAPRSLARLCRARLGHTPQQLLNQRLASEAARMLRQGDASAARVAEALGFCDPSYFSRFYKRMTGRRPGEERAPQRAGSTNTGLE